jgi:hypothetical protein
MNRLEYRTIFDVVVSLAGIVVPGSAATSMSFAATITSSQLASSIASREPTMEFHLCPRSGNARPIRMIILPPLKH